jgi:WD40 repeat protein
MGQITAIDFEQYCQTFITCSQSGVIILWDFQEKKIMRRVMTKEPLQLIKSFIFDRKTIAYN